MLIAPDRKALTTTFSALDVSVGDDESTRPDAMRIFPLTLPLTGAAQNATITFHASGYAFTQGATARVTLRVNGRKIVKNFRSGWNDDYLQTLELPAIPGSTYRLSVVLEAHQTHGSHDDNIAKLNVLALDVQVT